ncbi:MAG: magnesium transporter [Kofleriaceae bacterium]|nr:magnesium transporter [Kofleriaceae bacterium]
MVDDDPSRPSDRADAPRADGAGVAGRDADLGGDGWALDGSAEAHRLDPAEAREVAAEIKAVADSRGDDSQVVSISDLAEPAPGPAAADEPLSADDLRDAWPLLDLGERSDGLRILPREDAEDLFIGLPAADQAKLILHWPGGQRRQWMRLLEPDDVADVIQEAGDDARGPLLALLDEPTRKEVTALLAYAEDEAGGLMNTRYAHLRPQMTVDEAISYLRRQAQAKLETIYIAYVLDPQLHLLGVVSFRDLFAAAPATTVADIMETEVVRVGEGTDQESLSHIFAEHDLNAIPVVDEAGRMKGIVTVDDIVDVVQEEATEDIQKFGGMAALEQPYLQSGLGDMVRKRGVWLTVLLFGQMLTATVIGHFQGQIEKAAVLSIFMPLVISSGGNSGSQASTLVIRAMALGELRAADWWRVVRRELLTGLALGVGMGVIGLLRVVLWPTASSSYGPHYALIGLTVGASLVGVVLFGTFLGAMLPFLLRRFGADPASASAPFVATLSDVTGLLIYFTIANLLLVGVVL